MRKKLTNFLFLFFLALGLKAQLKPTPFQFGPKIGVNVGALQISPNPSKITSKLALNINTGLFGRFNFKKLSLQPELLYQQTGGNLKSINEKHAYKYVSVPVLIGFEVLKNIHLVGGPEFSWATNAGWKKSGALIYGPDNKKDYALIIGTRIDLLDNFSLFNLNIRYTHGLENLTNRVIDNKPISFKNRMVEVSFTYNFSNYYSWYRKYSDKSRAKKNKK